MTKKFTITVTGDSADDVVLALEQVVKAVREGFITGGNSNDTGSYYFVSEGEFVPYRPELPETCLACRGHVVLARTPDEAACEDCGLRVAFDQSLGEWVN